MTIPTELRPPITNLWHLCISTPFFVSPSFIEYWIGFHIPQLLGVILLPVGAYFLHRALPTPHWSFLRATLTETYDIVGAILFWFSSSAVLIPAYVLPAMFLGHYLIVAVVLYVVAIALAVGFGVWEHHRWTQYVGTSVWGEDGERSEKEDRVFLPFYLWRNWDLWVIGVTEVFVGATTFGAIKYMTRIVWVSQIFMHVRISFLPFMNVLPPKHNPLPIS